MRPKFIVVSHHVNSSTDSQLLNSGRYIYKELIYWKPIKSKVGQFLGWYKKYLDWNQFSMDISNIFHAENPFNGRLEIFLSLWKIPTTIAVRPIKRVVAIQDQSGSRPHWSGWIRISTSLIWTNQVDLIDPDESGSRPHWSGPIRISTSLIWTNQDLDLINLDQSGFWPH